MMSTLTLARLAPLSRRCLFSRRSYDPVERHQAPCNALYSQNLQWHNYQGMDSKKINNPDSTCLLTNKSQAQYESLVIQLAETSFQATENSDYYSLHRLNYLIKPMEKIKFRHSKTLFMKAPNNALASRHRAFNPSNEHELSSYMRKFQGNSSKGTKGETNDSKQDGIGMRFATTLALLGLFSKTTSGDIEEERDRLTDREKLNKMKPFERKIAIGVLWMCDQEYGNANQLFHEALQMAQDERDEDKENLVLNLIATNYFESGDWDNAEKLFIDLMKRMIALDTAPTAPPILELSLKLASIYSKAQATHEKALKGFKFVINSLLYELEDIIGNIEELDIQSLSEEKKEALALLGWSYDWFAKHLLNVNDYNGAADMLQRALQISSKVLGQLHDQTLILFNDIGTTLAMNNAPEKGRTFIKKAVEGAIETQSKELASFYVNLGIVNLKLRKLQEAKRYCEYSIELIGKNREHHNSQEVIELSKSCLNEVERLMESNEN